MPFSTETSKRTAACAHFRGNSVITAPPTDHKCCHALDNSNKFRNPDHCSDISLRTQNAHPFSVLLLTFASQYGWKGRLSLNVDIWLLRVCQRSAGWKFEFQCIAGEESQVESRSSAFLSISLRDWFTSADDINSFAPPSLIRKYRHFLTSYFRSIPFLFFFFPLFPCLCSIQTLNARFFSTMPQLKNGQSGKRHQHTNTRAVRKWSNHLLLT